MKPLDIHYVQANGDCALLVFFKPHADKGRRLQALAAYIRDQQVDDIIDVVPTSDSLLLVFNQPADIDDELMLAINDACALSLNVDMTPQKHEIPVCYYPDVAPDLEAVLSQSGLTLEQLIKQHSSIVYTVDFLGFLPGFAYLKGRVDSLKLPRKSKPSQNTPAGSIAIANGQTGIYALNSPGGWHVIGRTPIELIDWHSEQVIRYQPLDEIQFKAIEYEQFKQYQS